MTGLGDRFDINAIRRKEEEAKRKALVRNAIGGGISLLVLIALAIALKVGWDKWQAHNEEVERQERQEAALRAQAEARRAAEIEERRKEHAAKVKAEREAREAAAKAEKERREAERIQREEAQRREREEREAERRREREARETERLNKEFSEDTLAHLRFDAKDRVVIRRSLEKLVGKIEVTEARWSTLSVLASSRTNAKGFFMSVNEGGAVTNWSGETYPSREQVGAMIAALNRERFTLSISFNRGVDADERRLELVTISPETGVTAPDGMVKTRENDEVTVWTVPFAYGDTSQFLLMDRAKADELYREWKRFVSKLNREAKGLQNTEEYIASRKADEFKEFYRKAVAEMATAPKEEVETKKTKPARKSGGLKSVRDKDDDDSLLSGPKRLGGRNGRHRR